MKPATALRAALLPLLLAAAAAAPAAPIEVLPVTTPARAVTAWYKQQVYADVAYFFYRDDALIRRYDIAAATWLPDLTLPAGAASFDVDDSGIFVSLSNGVQRYDHAGNPTTPLFTAVPASQGYLETGATFFVTYNGAGLRMFNKTTGAAVGNGGLFYILRGFTQLTANGRIFGSTGTVSPPDVHMLRLDPGTGAFISDQDSPYHGALLSGSLHWTNADASLLVDNSGTVYDGALNYLGNLGGALDKAVFVQDRIVVLRGNSIIVFSAAGLREIGHLPAPAGSVDLFVSGSMAYAASDGAGGVRIHALDLAAAQLPQPAPAAAWNRTPMQADELSGSGHQLFLLQRGARAAYHFNAQDWSLTTLPLFEDPRRMVYSAAQEKLFVSYYSGAIYAFAPAVPGQAAWHVGTPGFAYGLAAADDLLLAAAYSANVSTQQQLVFDSQGRRTGWAIGYFGAGDYGWDAAARRLYFFGAYSSSNLMWRQLDAAGAIVASGEGPYYPNTNAVALIRVAPGGDTVVLGSGRVLRASDLTQRILLDTTLVDAAWSGGSLYTLPAVGSGGTARLQRHDAATYAVAAQAPLRGTPRRLQALPNGNLLYVADVAGRSIVGVLDPQLSQADLAVDPPPAAPAALAGEWVEIDVMFGNNGSVDAPGARLAGDLGLLENASWRCMPLQPTNGCDQSLHQGGVDLTLDLPAGVTARLVVSGRIPASAHGRREFPLQLQAAAGTVEPELRNNSQPVGWDVFQDAIFADAFEGVVAPEVR